MTKCFCNQKFRSLLLTASFSMVIEYLMLLSDTIIIGNIFGEAGVSAVNIVIPVFSIAVFITTLNSIGTSVLYSYEIGKFDKNRANSLFGQGIIIAVSSGIILFLAAFFGKGLYFGYMNPSAEILKLVKDYYFYYQFIVLLYPIYGYLIDMVYSDGDELICNISYIVQIAVNIPVSILLCHKIGIAGASLGTLIGTVLSITVLILHFFRKQNSMKFIWHISKADILKIVKFGITDSGIYLFWGMTSFAASKLVISRFGEYYLPVLSVVINILEITIIFDGIGQAVTPILNVYRGEKNDAGVKKVMKTAFITAIFEGIAASVLLFIFGRFFALMLGISDPELLDMSLTAIRIVSPFFFCSSVLFLMTTYYLLIEKQILSAVITGIKDSVTLITFMLIFSIPFGIYGVWTGIGISPVISLAVSILIVCTVYGKSKFPLLTDKEESEIYSYDIYITPENITELRDKAENILKEKNVDKSVIYKIMLTIEEVCMLISEKNPDKKILSECTIIIGDDIQLIIRDNGIIFDVTDADCNISSIRSYVVANMMIHQQKKMHLVTTSYNRNIFRFDKKFL